MNVWAPEGANETTRLPVWVFIQGGGNLIPVLFAYAKVG